MLESPQKKPRLYGVTAFSSHAKNGMEADEMWERKGGEADKKNGLMNVCEHVVCARTITERARCRDTRVSQEREGSSLKSVSHLVARFPDSRWMKHSTHSCIHQRISEKER